MPNPFKVYGVDEALASEGVWRAFGGGDPPMEFKIGRMGVGNMRYKKALEKHTGPRLKEIVDDTISDDDYDAINLQSFIEGCLLDWRNVEDGDGNPIAFSHEAAFELLSDLRLIELRAEMEAFARNRPNFQRGTEKN